MSGRSTPPPGSRGRGAGRGNTSGQPRGRGGRGRGAESTTNRKAEGRLQGLETGSLNKRGESSSARAGRGEIMPPMPRKRMEWCSGHSPGNHFVLSQPEQPMTSACLPKKGRSATPRGPSQSMRARAAMAGQANASFVQPSTAAPRANPSHKDFMTEMTTKFQYVSHISQPSLLTSYFPADS